MGHKKNNGLAPIGQRDARTSFQKIFADRIGRLQLEWLTHDYLKLGTEEDYKLLNRLRTDERMRGAWVLLASLSDVEFCDFIVLMLYSIDGIRATPRLRKLYQTRRAMTDEARRATERFMMICRELPLRKTVLQEMMGIEDQWSTIADVFPDLLPQLKKVHEFILATAVDCAADEKGDLSGMSRKFEDGCADIFRSLADLIRRITGKPHYNVVAALANVILNTGDDDDITADAVRKAVARKKLDYSPE